MSELGEKPAPAGEDQEISEDHVVVGSLVPLEGGPEDTLGARDQLAGMYAKLGRVDDAVQLWFSVLDGRLREGAWLEALRVCKHIHECAPAETSAAHRFSAAAKAAPDEAPILYGALSAASLHATLAVLRSVDAPAGAVVAEAGAPGDSNFLVLRGALRCAAAAGESALRSRVLRAGDTCFDAALVVSVPRPLTVTALEDTVYFELPRAGFDEVTKRFPDALAALRESQKRQLFDRPPPRAHSVGPASPPLPVERPALELDRSARFRPATDFERPRPDEGMSAPRSTARVSTPEVAGRLTSGWLWLVLLAGGVIAYERGALDSLGAAMKAPFGGPSERARSAAPTPKEAIDGREVEGRVKALFGAGAPTALRRERSEVEQVAPGITFDENGDLVGNAAVMEKLRRESRGDDGAGVNMRGADVGGVNVRGADGAITPPLAKAAALVEQAPAESLALLPEGEDEPWEETDPRYRALIRARALDVLGRPIEAIGTLKDVSLEVPFHRGLEAKQLELRVRSGRCLDGMPNARRLAAEGGIDGTLAYLRFRLLCFGLVDEVVRDAGTLLSLPRLPSQHQAELHGMVALAHLQRDEVSQALDACRKMRALDPSHLETALVAARCAALGDLPVRADDFTAPRYDAERWAVSVAHLQRGVPPPPWPDAPNWHRGAAFLRALALLPERGPIAAIDESRGALTAPPWDGSPTVPLTYAELAAVIGYFPANHRAFAEGLARALTGRVIDDEQEAWGALLKAAAVYADRLYRTRRSTPLPEAAAIPIGHPELRRSVLARYLRSDAREAEAFLGDPQLGPLAAYEFELRGGRASSAAAAQLAHHRHHPWLAALELHRRER